MLAMPPTAAFQMSVPLDEFPVLPFTVAIVESARVVLASLRPLDTGPASKHQTNRVVSMCVHLGWDLVRWKPTLEAVVIEIKTMTTLRGVTRLFVAASAKATADGVYLVANLPGGTEMGCDRVKWPPRCQISARQAVTEMAVCALRDFLVGSPFSTFTGVIAAQRERIQRKDSAHRCLLSYAGPAPRSPPHFLALTVHNDKYT
ncbi:uncharacterized protein ACA1_354320 [Acanthamoeba castellanii str. Neff]|uniref:Uncharacterized protein n=1 Tax=Acanthamoeba castellanii (strain ATCC 30010 / Neff) TaxID=1257118 RepID=L8GDQ9_ACACF|nr:uncharacterized protein ACA1_354320 [Acanthamoeba castellanii str. Neff]ELR10994.1 hypothetical protein ACA1_354320 [Acanthamoeba castellanii str. Neff]